MLEQVMALTQLCKSAIAAGKTLKKWKSSQLTDRERELLVSAAESGVFQIMQSDQFGLFVMAGNKAFAETDPALTAHYFDAFTKLCDRGLITATGDDMFRLTGQAFDIARLLAGPSRQI